MSLPRHVARAVPNSLQALSAHLHALVGRFVSVWSKRGGVLPSAALPWPPLQRKILHSPDVQHRGKRLHIHTAEDNTRSTGIPQCVRRPGLAPNRIFLRQTQFGVQTSSHRPIPRPGPVTRRCQRHRRSIEMTAPPLNVYPRALFDHPMLGIASSVSGCRIPIR
jgi:hypothetical protein